MSLDQATQPEKTNDALISKQPPQMQSSAAAMKDEDNTAATDMRARYTEEEMAKWKEEWEEKKVYIEAMRSSGRLVLRQK